LKKPLAQPGGPRKGFLAWYGLQMSDSVSETTFGDILNIQEGLMGDGK
jgi:hypothetical protein